MPVPIALGIAGLALSALGQYALSRQQSKKNELDEENTKKEFALKEMALAQEKEMSDRKHSVDLQNSQIGRISALKTLRDDWKTQRFNNAMYSILGGEQEQKPLQAQSFSLYDRRY